jgi:hypothetical protein
MTTYDKTGKLVLSTEEQDKHTSQFRLIELASSHFVRVGRYNVPISKATAGGLLLKLITNKEDYGFRVLDGTKIKVAIVPSL